MDHSLVSRRVAWACSGLVEVAPHWPLGTPPPLDHFMSLRHVRLYISVVSPHIRPYRNSDEYVYLRYTDFHGILDQSAIWWTQLFCPTYTIWDNYSARIRFVNCLDARYLDIVAVTVYKNVYRGLIGPLIDSLT